MSWYHQTGTFVSRREYWSRLPFPSPGDLPHPGMEPMSPALQAHSLPLSLQGSPQSIAVDKRKGGVQGDPQVSSVKTCSPQEEMWLEGAQK